MLQGSAWGLAALRQQRERPCPSDGLQKAVAALLDRAERLCRTAGSHGVQELSATELDALRGQLLPLMRSLASCLQRVSALLLCCCPPPLSAARPPARAGQRPPTARPASAQPPTQMDTEATERIAGCAPGAPRPLPDLYCSVLQALRSLAQMPALGAALMSEPPAPRGGRMGTVHVTLEALLAQVSAGRVGWEESGSAGGWWLALSYRGDMRQHPAASPPAPGLSHLYSAETSLSSCATTTQTADAFVRRSVHGC